MTRVLRSAIEFAVAFAQAGRKARPPVEAPAELLAQSGASRVPTVVLGRLRRAIEDDDEFRQRLAVAAPHELVDEAGRAWLRDDPDWEATARAVGDERQREREDRHAEARAKREEKRRQSAEAATARARVEVVALTQALDEARRRLTEHDSGRSQLSGDVERLREQVSAERQRARQATDRWRSATTRIETLQAELEDLKRQLDEARNERDRLLLARASLAATEPALASSVLDDLRRLARATRSVADELEQVVTVPGVSREAVALPGAVRGDRRRAAEFLLRQPSVLVVLDGYNVALVRPGADRTDLRRQREDVLGLADDLARRWHLDVVVVFDGADVVGAHAPTRRLVRVEYSPAGITADDLIRGIVRTTPVTRPVVVVTNDNEIRRDVTVEGANVVGSETLWELQT